MNVTPCYSIIIPDYNEEKRLTRTLSYVKKPGPEGQVFYVRINQGLK